MEENSMNSNYETPQSMSFGNTPKRTTIQQHVCTPLQRIKERDVQEEETRVKTPVTINPFEVKADSLYFPSCSPSLFATFAKNKTNNGQFRWSIDHVSVLYPADIDESTVQEVWVDPDHERQAQIAIDAFFSQNSIVPSPWSSDSKNKREIKFKRTIGESCDVGTQTMLTIPPAIDLLALLGEEFMYKEENDSSCCSSSNSSSSSLRESDVMSTSSLRRKLFANDEDCRTPKLERKDLAFAKQWSTPTINRQSTQSTPSDLISSSPITPPNCSEFCVIRSSPQMSPIAGPSSHKSFRMRSFIERLDEESSSQQQPEKPPSSSQDSCMSFLVDSQDTGAFQSYASEERQDTGYNTGSLFSSSQNVTDSSMVFQSRIHPPTTTEQLDDCGFFNTTSNMSCSADISMATSPVKSREVDLGPCGSEKWSFPPNGCSTPTLRLGHT